MFVPIFSDSEKNHWPVGTGILILCNVIVFGVQLSVEKDTYLRFALEYGSGLNPLQWFTAMFLHGNVSHLIGNMLFLWVFGLVVEGRIGTPKFLLLYLSMGIAQNFIEQATFGFFASGRSLGASGAIYSIILLAMLWAPQDNVKFFYWLYWLFYFHFGFFDVPILILALVYMGLDGWEIITSDDYVTTGLLHLVGALVGAIVGAIFLWRKWVYCNGEDLFSLIRVAQGSKLKVQERPKTAHELREEKEREKEHEEDLRIKWKSVDFHLAAGNAKAAIIVFRKLKQELHDVDWDEARLLKIISIFQKQENWDESINFSQVYLDRFQSQFTTVGLNAAKICQTKLRSPRKACQFLKQIAPRLQNEQQKQMAAKIQQAAQKSIDDGEIELS